MGLLRLGRVGALAALFALFLGLLSPHEASAQGSDAEARALFAAGEVAYGEGRYESALEYFQRAYELSHRPLLLYNIGGAAEHLRRDAEALAAFEQFLAEVPDSPNRAAVEARIAILRRVTAATAATTTTTTETTTGTGTATGTATTTTTETGSATATATATETGTGTTTHTETSTVATTGTPAGDSGPGVGPYVLIGVGAAVLVAGAVLVGVGYADSGSVTDAPDGATWSSISGAYDRAPLLEGVGFALLGVGAAAAVGGVIWAVSGGGSRESAGASAWLDDRSAGVLAWGNF